MKVLEQLLIILLMVSLPGPGKGDPLEQLEPCPKSPNCVCSEGDPSDTIHFIEPLHFDGSAEAAMGRVRSIIAGWERTEILQKSSQTLQATQTSRLMKFVDDFELRLDEDAGVIHVRSASRVGFGDMGVNRKRVERLRSQLKTLEQKKGVEG